MHYISPKNLCFSSFYLQFLVRHPNFLFGAYGSNIFSHLPKIYFSFHSLICLSSSPALFLTIIGCAGSAWNFLSVLCEMGFAHIFPVSITKTKMRAAVRAVSLEISVFAHISLFRTKPKMSDASYLLSLISFLCIPVSLTFVSFFYVPHGSPPSVSHYVCTSRQSTALYEVFTHIL
jgi:hypothetical protein